MTIDRPITIALIFFGILLLVFFLVAPEYKAFKNLQTDLGIKTAEYNAEFDYYAEVARIYAELKARGEEVQKIDDALPKNPDLGPVIYYLQQTAKKNGLTVKNLFLSKSSTNSSGQAVSGNVKDIAFSMDLSGGYASLEGFLLALERSARIFEVNSISFGSQNRPPYSFNLQIKTFSY